jgi:CBS domain-containing protein
MERAQEGLIAQRINEVMTPNPVTLPADRSAVDAAKLMRDQDIGDLIVMEQNRVMGIVTDRDIVVRVVAGGQEPAQVKLADICSKELHSVEPTDPEEEAINLMREKAVRRILVMDDGSPIGIVSIEVSDGI